MRRLLALLVVVLALATPALAERARSEAIYKGEKFSDHAPVTIDYEQLL